MSKERPRIEDKKEQILELNLEKKNTQQIADELGISKRAVQNCLKMNGAPKYCARCGAILHNRRLTFCPSCGAQEKEQKQRERTRRFDKRYEYVVKVEIPCSDDGREYEEVAIKKSNARFYAKDVLGNSNLGEHRIKDFKKESRAIQREFKRLKLRP